MVHGKERHAEFLKSGVIMSHSPLKIKTLCRAKWRKAARLPAFHQAQAQHDLVQHLLKTILHIQVENKMLKFALSPYKSSFLLSKSSFLPSFQISKCKK